MKYISMIFFLIFLSGVISASDLIHEIWTEISDNKSYDNKRYLEDRKRIDEYLKKDNKLSSQQAEELVMIFNFFYEFSPDQFYLTLKIALEMKKEQILMLRPLYQKILDDPNSTTGSIHSILWEADKIFDDLDGALLFKYKAALKSEEKVLLLVFGGLSFNERRLETFREYFIDILNNEDEELKMLLYKELKARVSVLNCLSEKTIEKASSAEKAEQLLKMREWLESKPNLKEYFKQNFEAMLAKLKSLTPANYNHELKELKKNYTFLNWMPRENQLRFDPLNEEDMGFSEGKTFLTNELQQWFEGYKEDPNYYSSYQLDLLIRSIEKKLYDRNRNLRSLSFLRPGTIKQLKERIANMKVELLNKELTVETKMQLGHLLEHIKSYVRKSQEDYQRDYFLAILDDFRNSIPANLKPDVTGILSKYPRYLIVESNGAKVQITDEGMKVKLSLKNLRSTDIVIDKNFSISKNVAIYFRHLESDELYRVGEYPYEVKLSSEDLKEKQVLKPNESVSFIISDLDDEIRKLNLPKGDYKVGITYFSYSGKDSTLGYFQTLGFQAEKK